MMLFDDSTVREFGEKYAEKVISALQQLFSADKVQLVKDVILNTVGNGLRQLEDRLQKTLNAVSFDSLESEQLHNLEPILLYVENYVMQMFRDLLTKDPPIISLNTLLLYDDTMMPTKPTKSKRDLFRETFQTTHNELLENIEPNGLLLDHLAQEKIITSSDEDSIASGSGRRGQTRKLLSIMSSASTDQIENGFLPALQATHPNLAEKFMKTYKDLEQQPNNPSASETCLPCRIKNEVDLSRIAHVLYTRNSIDKNMCDDLCNTSVSNQMKWKIISDKPKTHIAVIESLETKYKALYQQCQHLHTNDLNCTCPTLKLNAPSQLTTDRWNQDELESSPESRYFKSIPTPPRNASNSSVAGLSRISSDVTDQQIMLLRPRVGRNRLAIREAFDRFRLNRWLDFESLDSAINNDRDLNIGQPTPHQSTRQNTSASSVAGGSNLFATLSSQSMLSRKSFGRSKSSASSVEAMSDFSESGAWRGVRDTKSSASSVAALSDFSDFGARRGVRLTKSSASSVAALSDFSDFELGRSICSDE